MNKAMRAATALLLVLILSGSVVQDCHNAGSKRLKTVEFHLGATPGGTVSFTTTNPSGDPAELPSGQCSEAACAFVTVSGARLALVATAAPGFRFERWRGGERPDQVCAAEPEKTAAATLRLLSDAGQFCVAEFAPDGDTVELTINVTGNGSVATRPALIAGCTESTPSCSARFPAGESVELVPTPSAGSHFVSWSKDCEGGANFLDEVQLTLNAPATCGATFAPGPGMQAQLTGRTEGGFDLGLSILVHSSFHVVATVGNPNPALTYGYDWDPMPPSVCSFWARDDAMSTFDADWWRCVIESDAMFKVTVRASDGETKVLVRPVRAASDDSRLTITEVFGAGRVLDPPEGAAINCRIGSLPEACTEIFDGAARVNLRAQPDAGHAFATWGLDCAAFSAQRDITVDLLAGQGRSCTASFVPIPSNQRTLIVEYRNGAPDRSVVSTTGDINCGAFVNSVCTGDFNQGELVTLTATPAQVEWLGCTGTAAGGFCQVRMSEDRIVIATFAP